MRTTAGHVVDACGAEPVGVAMKQELPRAGIDRGLFVRREARAVLRSNQRWEDVTDRTLPMAPSLH